MYNGLWLKKDTLYVFKKRKKRDLKIQIDGNKTDQQQNIKFKVLL